MVGDCYLAQGRHVGLSLKCRGHGTPYPQVQIPQNMSETMLTKIRIGHSPDADDAFMFYAIAKGKIPLDGFEVKHVIEDIETLNLRALQLPSPTVRPSQSSSVGARSPRSVGGETPPLPLEVTALSCYAFGLVSDRYQLLPYGASVGDNYGPVVVGKTRGNIRGKRIAVPGRYTTAYLVLQLYEKDFRPVFTPFEKIFDAVRNGDADFGLLIHEGQLTYSELGFEKIVDLGEWWHQEFGLPLPLGINAIRRDLAEEVKSRFNRLFLSSIDYAMTHRPEAIEYALEFGRGIDPKKGDRFVGMYVNDYSLDLGEKGLRGLSVLYERAYKKSLLPSPVKSEVYEPFSRKKSLKS